MLAQEKNGSVVEYAGPMRLLDVRVIAHRTGFRCGYVRVPPDHPAAGLHHDDDLLAGIVVHGGLTYGRKDTEDDSHWFGFDCMHAGDGYDESIMDDTHKAVLSHMATTAEVRTVRTLEYVKLECDQLARQLRKMYGDVTVLKKSDENNYPDADIIA